MEFIRNGRHSLKLSRFSKGRRKLFAEHQELIRKDVQRAFGALQARFSSIQGPVCVMKEEEAGVIMRACVIVHNMIVKDEGDNFELVFYYDVVEGIALEPIINHDHHPCYKIYFQRSNKIRNLTHM